MWTRLIIADPVTYVTGSGKTGLIATITDIHFLPVRESCTHALPRNTQVLDHRWPGLLLQTAFYRCCQTTRVHFVALKGINRTAWGTRLLLLTAVLASLVDSTSLCPTPRAQHCCLSPNGYFSPPSASHPPPPPPTPYRLNP